MATFRLTLRTSADDSTAVRHLRQALKLLWRKYGLRCTHIEQTNKPTAHEYGAAELMRVFHGGDQAKGYQMKPYQIKEKV